MLTKISWIAFAEVLGQVLEETARPEEDSFKETFKVRINNIWKSWPDPIFEQVFSKNDGGCIPMEEIKFVLSHVCSDKVDDLMSQAI